MRARYERNLHALTKNEQEMLSGKRVCIVGCGGLGGYLLEYLLRAGIGHITVIDGDCFEESNLNRQIIATKRTVGKYKVDVMKERILEINPQANVIVHKCFFLPETEKEFDFTEYDYVIDAVDTVTAKIAIIMRCEQTGTRVISSMGAGNKLEASMFEVADIYKTSVCPLARVMRRELKKRNVKKCKVVYSKEIPLGIQEEAEHADASQIKGTAGRRAPGSIAFVPAAAGLILAGEVVKDLING